VRYRRLVAALLVPTIAVVPAAPVHAAYTGGVALVLPAVAPMLPGQQGWLAALWTATVDVCDVQVTVAGPGLTVTYPANTGTYTSFYTASALATGNIDYTAFNVTVPASVTAPVTLTLTVSYNELPAGQLKKDDDLKTKKVDCKGPKGGETATATLPVYPSTSAAIIQKTVSASVPKSMPTWTNITFRGTRPNLANFRVTLSPPTGLTVVYPGDGTSSGLHAGTALPVGADDYAAVRLDASGLATGTYQVPVHVSYTGGSYDSMLTVTVT
jgi:hypothetical protein